MIRNSANEELPHLGPIARSHGRSSQWETYGMLPATSVSAAIHVQHFSGHLACMCQVKYRAYNI
jgi:hypothetical protein